MRAPAALQERLEQLQQQLSKAEAALEAVLEGIKGEVEGYHQQLSQVGARGEREQGGRGGLPPAAERGGGKRGKGIGGKRRAATSG